MKTNKIDLNLIEEILEQGYIYVEYTYFEEGELVTTHITQSIECCCIYLLDELSIGIKTTTGDFYALEDLNKYWWLKDPWER